MCLTDGAFIGLAQTLEVPLAHEKTEGPAVTFTSLGIELGTIQQISRLLEVKLEALWAQVASLLGCDKVTLMELQQLLGHLNFVCRVVAPGKAFMWHVYDMMERLHLLHHWLKLTREMELRVWDIFLQDFDGISFWRDDMKIEGELQVTLMHWDWWASELISGVTGTLSGDLGPGSMPALLGIYHF